MTLLKFKVDYFNPKYFSFLKISLKKYSRQSPYYLNCEADALTGVGNNVTVSKINTFH